MAVIVACHFQVELHLCLVLSLMHEKIELEGIERQQVIIVLDDVYYLVGGEIGKEVNDELLVVF